MARIEFDTTLGGRDVCIGFDRTTRYSHDATYGSDADGRRGTPTTFIDEDSAGDVEVAYNDVDEYDAQGWFTLDVLPALDVPEVERLVRAYMDEHEPEQPEQPERDYDDTDD